jgi:long-chain acyl-CoA synthetase
MAMTWEQSIGAVFGAGSPLELVDANVHGVDMRVFKNAPQHLGQVFDIARAHGDKTFLVYEGERISFADVMARVDAVADLLVNGYKVRQGDRVAIAMRNYPEWVVSFAAITSIGAISVSMNSWWSADEIDYALEDSGSSILITDIERHALATPACERLGIKQIVVRASGALSGDSVHWSDVVKVGAAHPRPEIDTDADATILYTSGTTGRPKGAVSTHRAIISALMTFAARGTIDGLRKDTPPDPNAPATAFILIVPLFHVTGCVPVMLGCFLTGAKLVIMYKWDAGKALPIIQEEGITNFVGVPTQSWDLVNHPDFAKFDTSSLRAVGGGGAPAPAALVDKVAKSVKNGGPQLGYGMTETNAFGPGNNGKDYTDRPTSTGRTLPPMTIQIRDENLREVPTGERGEVWFFGPMLIRGYWNKPDATAETIVDGWLRSGDVGRVDDEGFLYIEDRVKDMILRAGENVYSAEVEGAIYEHPAVHEVAVFGVPHERMGEEVAVAIKPNDGMSISAEELWEFLAGKIAAFKVPSKVAVMNESLPRNAAGKFLKRELQQWVVDGKLAVTSR